MNWPGGALVILVTGSRDWPESGAHVIAQALSGVLDDAGWGSFVDSPPVLLHGGCLAEKGAVIAGTGYRGVDGIADAWWRRLIAGGGPFTRLPDVREAEWQRWGREAGPIRNAGMVDDLARHCDAGGRGVVLGFPWGPSPGTRGCLRLAHERAGLRVVTVEGADMLGRKPSGRDTRPSSRRARQVWDR